MKRSPLKAYLLPVLAIGSAVFATVSVVRTQPFRSGTAPTSPPPASSFGETVAAVGLIEANSENVNVGTPVSGIVAEVRVRPDQSVRIGTPLFRMDTRQLEASLTVEESRLAAARARLDTARCEAADLADRLDRSRRLRSGTVISEEELVRSGFALDSAQARVAEALAQVGVAESLVSAVRTEIARCTVVAPIDGTVLQLRIRPGEFASASASSAPNSGPPLVLGNLEPLHVRVDIDEHEAWRVHPGARARGHVRGNSSLSAPLTFVRIEPFVIPKRSLTGDSIERVDTRVLQALYRIEAPVGDTGRHQRLFPGQQMDVFIEAPKDAVEAPKDAVEAPKEAVEARKGGGGTRRSEGR